MTSALVYTAYILTGDRVLTGIAPLSLTALVCCGAATTYAVATALRGGPTSLDSGATAWFWLVTLSLVSTVGAIIFFFAGLVRLGPSVASILSISSRSSRSAWRPWSSVSRCQPSSCWEDCWCSPPWSSSGQRRPGTPSFPSFRG